MTMPRNVRLPLNIKPKRYTLDLKPDLREFVFWGQETIDLEIIESTSTIILHALDIKIQNCNLILPHQIPIIPLQTIPDKNSGTIRFIFDQELPKGPAILKLDFTGEINDRLRGFYRSHYFDADGDENYVATTQFEATEARRAFPCWDEPSFKAIFELTITIPNNMVAISNMPISKESKITDGLKTVRFQATPAMSTYLVAFVIGDLKYVEGTAKDGTVIRVWATAGKEEQGRFALQTSLQLLDYFNDYFGIPYPLPKLDHLALPDFAAGAMENWGAITYREVALLIDDQQSSSDIRQRVAAIVSHEMAHMWFGDLVTMDWWNDLWLNESFASWIGDKAIDSIFPEWEMWTEFVSSDTNTALSLDGLKNSHPIEQKVTDPSEIGELFDAISYSKGGSILRMLEHYLGPDIFRKGLQKYISRHKYDNAETHDLWVALAEVSNQPVAEMMDSWIRQTGYPVVTIDTDHGQGSGILSATQSRFTYEHLVENDTTDETLWHIPINWFSNGKVSVPVIMNQSKIAIQKDTRGSKEWIKVNPEQIGFFRVNYEKALWKQLNQPINTLALSAIDRLGVQNDAYALSKAGYLPVTQFLSLAQSYTNETDARVWQDLASNLGSLDSLLHDEKVHQQFKSMARQIFEPAGERIGWDGDRDEGHLQSLLRSTILAQLGRYSHVNTLQVAESKFNSYLEKCEPIHPDLRSVVYNLAAQQGDLHRYDTMWELHQRASMEEEKVRLLAALTNFRKPELLEKTLEKSLSNQVRIHDTILVIVRLGNNPLGRDKTWEFVKENWSEFEHRYGDGLFALNRLIGFISHFRTEEELADVTTFFQNHRAPGAERAIKQAKEIINLNIKWLSHNRNDLDSWFNSQHQS